MSTLSFSFFSFFFPVFSLGLVQLYIAGLPLRSCWTTGAPSVQGAFPNVQFSFLAAAGFEPISLSLQCGRVTVYITMFVTFAKLPDSGVC